MKLLDLYVQMTDDELKNVQKKVKFFDKKVMISSVVFWALSMIFFCIYIDNKNTVGTLLFISCATIYILAKFMLNTTVSAILKTRNNLNK